MDNLKLFKLQLTNFRNIESEIIDFSEGINCIFGNNGNGKTNILEAVYYLINRKSFRKNTTFSQLISMDCEKPEIIFSSAFKRNQEIISYSGKLDKLGSQWYLNNDPVKQKIQTYTEFINPFDSFTFHNTPSFRRSWFDSHISVISTNYKKVLNKYNQGLRFRNNLLTSRRGDYKDQIIAIDKQMAEYSFVLVNERLQFISQLKDYCGETFKKIFEQDHSLEIFLDTKFNNFSIQDIQEYLKCHLDSDIQNGMTKYGVHRDDYVFHFDGLNSYDYCSLGQQKMSFLSLIFAYIELFRYKFTSYPIVLVDDVSGELDERRWKNLIYYLKEKKFQVLITTANENFKRELEQIEEAKKLYVDCGKVTAI
jgi:DNA replication and repair protein RecF